MNIKHVFFDLDHTLWDFEANSAKTFQIIFEKNNVAISLDDFLEPYIPINLTYWKLYRDEKISKEDLRYRRLKETFDAINFTVSDDLIHQLSEDYIEKLPFQNKLIDGTIEILDYLKPNYSLDIITNGFRDVQHVKLKESGILHYFDNVISSESVGLKKPNPKVFEHALQLSGAKPEESLMVGDNIEADYLGAVNVNMNAVLCDFDSNYTDKKDIKIINSLTQLKQYL